MIPDAATTSTPAPQAATPQAAAAPASQSAPASLAPQITPVQLLWEVATLAFELMRRLVNVLQPIQQYYPKPALLLARLLIDIPRIFLTIRYAPERVTIAQLRHLTRARHILQALFNYDLPLGPRTSPSATATAHQHPSASPENATPLGPRTSPSASATANQSPSASTESATPLGARTPSSATTPSPATPASPSLNPSPSTPSTPSIRQVPEIPMVAGLSHVPASPAVDHNPLTPSPISHPSHSSHDSHASPTSYPSHDPQSANNNSAFRIQHSAFSPYIPDFHTLAQALKSNTLPPNCAGALFENPGDALVRALHQLHTIYFSLYPNQPPTPVQSPSPSPSQSSFNPQSTIQVRRPSEPSRPQSPSPSPSQSSGNLQSSICNLQSDIPQSAIHNPQSNAPP